MDTFWNHTMKPPVAVTVTITVAMIVTSIKLPVDSNVGLLITLL